MSWVNSVALLGAAAGLLLLGGSGCSEAKKAAQGAADRAAGSEKVAPAASGRSSPDIEVPPGDGPVARVAGEPIPREAFNRRYRRLMERYARARHEVKPDLRERIKDNIVRRLVDRALVRREAEKMGIALDPDQVERRWQEHKKRYGSDEAFAAFLERAGTSAEEVRSDFEDNFLQEAVFRRIGEAVTVSGQEVRDFYEENEDRYARPEMIRASHILVRVPAGAEPSVVKEKKALARKIRREAAAEGSDFATLAARHGEDPTKDKGGDLGFFPRGRMVEAFEKAVWDLEVGEIAPVTRTQFGFHVIRKTGQREADKQRFEDVDDQIERGLLARKRNEAIRSAIERWREQTDIEILLKGDPSIINAGYDQPPKPGTPEFLKGAAQTSSRAVDPSEL